MIGEWFKLTALSSGSLLGVYIVFGLIFDQIEQLNIQYIAGALGKIGIILTGFIGTVVHEFSHYILCLVFGHKVTEVAWFRPIRGMQDGVLGYVQHSYNPTNLYQQIGNFFIGIAPLLLGSVFIFLLFKICLPKSARQFSELMTENMRGLTSSFTIGNILRLIVRQTGSLFKVLFTKENIKKPIFWIFLFMVYSISTHMSLSFADLQGALVGLGTILIGITVICFILALVHLPVKKWAGLIVKYNAFVISIFSIGLSFAFITLLISGALYYCLP